MTAVKEPQARARAQALEAVAQLGGKLTAEEDITYEGTRFIIPERLNLRDAVGFLTQRMQDDETVTQFSRTFPYRPLDGARATGKAIRTAFGFTMGKTIQSFWGSEPPQFIDVRTGPGQDDVEQVPWGAMLLPGLDNTTLYFDTERSRELGVISKVTVNTPRKNRWIIEGLFKLIDEYLRTDSIYRGKAIDGSDEFLDTSTVDPNDVVYSEAVMKQMEASVWSRIRYADNLAALGQKGKRSVLFEGPYGTGKSLAALLTAQVALANGWTFLMCRPGRDNMRDAMQMARMYQPAVVFAEDVDTFAGAGNADISETLDLFDGINAKGLRMLLVMTTNHADRIHKGMVRPGRLDAVIHIGPMDRPGVERLTRRVVGNALDPTTDFDRVFKAMEGYMPAFVREALDRAVGYSVSLNQGHLGQIDTEALVLAADGLRDQLALMEGAADRVLGDKLSEAVRDVVDDAVTNVVQSAYLSDSDGDWAYDMRVNGH